MESSFIKKSIAAFLGFAIGDAFGATTEFMTKKEIEVKYGKLKSIVGGGWLHLKPGKVTDDTEMSIALARSIVDNKSFSQKIVADYFLKWMQSKPVDIGNTIRFSLINYMKKSKYEADYDESSAGNGALMRSVPVCIYAKGDVDVLKEIALKQAHITHNNKLSDLAVINYCETLNILLTGGSKIQALEKVSKFINEHKIFSFSRYKGENSGYIVDTYKAIMHFYFEGVSFKDTMIETVNNGGDSDTIGALVGALCGATYELNSIPKKWINKLDKNVYKEIMELTVSLCNLRVNIF
ncbi:ADP-ribosyl-[dinitrogen reductase] hydrolase [Calditerrivibrio nitroreducens]|uniref:ADP-ribosyl-(Dinitrogen reductase) hydrolase n=1 Tax=Calditerrivibrio nitroreducens (strain DSM 19672 / NBRC 101217 / Yu37-1) TaxID=768670 RepID=E4TG43_CALNY|nr:ADP-ribosyl-[dinitrogen reductase] hydrolase [Calditerrivibrio nitroreducens]ADR18593.1 ADP-ribosyl-(dinitrogen reductase) hydrolase [Calditerrivibrio nitroreducens DSM 19672]